MYKDRPVKFQKQGTALFSTTLFSQAKQNCSRRITENCDDDNILFLNLFFKNIMSPQKIDRGSAPGPGRVATTRPKTVVGRSWADEPMIATFGHREADYKRVLAFLNERARQRCALAMVRTASNQPQEHARYMNRSYACRLCRVSSARARYIV